MKLIFCQACGDVFKLVADEVRTCACGESAGRYIDAVNAEYSGDLAVPMVVDNKALARKVKRWNSGVPPCDTFKEVDEVNAANEKPDVVAPVLATTLMAICDKIAQAERLVCQLGDHVAECGRLLNSQPNERPENGFATK